MNLKQVPVKNIWLGPFDMTYDSIINNTIEGEKGNISVGVIRKDKFLKRITRNMVNIHKNLLELLKKNKYEAFMIMYTDD